MRVLACFVPGDFDGYVWRSTDFDEASGFPRSDSRRSDETKPPQRLGRTKSHWLFKALTTDLNANVCRKKGRGKKQENVDDKLTSSLCD